MYSARSEAWLIVINLDADYLADLGLGPLAPEEAKVLLHHIYETLEERVGLVLANQMSNSQLDEFEVFFEAKDDAGAFRWLEREFPNYKEIVALQYEILTSEVRKSVPTILALAGGTS